MASVCVCNSNNKIEDCVEFNRMGNIYMLVLVFNQVCKSNK